MRINEIKQGLKDYNYLPSKEIVYALSGAINNHYPLLVEGDPGVGKTSLAIATAKMIDAPLLRVQFYEGLTADKILYDYDYQRQLLTIEAIKSTLENLLKDKNMDDAFNIAKCIDFYGKDFIIARPILKSILSDKRCVLLLDEVDKASEEIEYTLLEFLDTYSISIPQYKTICCNDDKKPIVFLTSNNYRLMSDALKRRCNFLYIQSKTKEEMFEILKMQSHVSEKLCLGVANCLTKIQKLSLKQTPSISEAIDWAQYIYENYDQNNMDDLDHSICALLKNKQDQDVVLNMNILDDLKHDLT
ncbi:MAG: MoxR family ATPase [Erysipelotrichaceae bacterium]|nr:MoxR family ATPase [Erysipelotrichaceae bacterium]